MERECKGGGGRGGEMQFHSFMGWVPFFCSLFIPVKCSDEV